MDDIVKKSPDGLYTATLSYDSEIRFGPAYYSLRLGQMDLKGMVFGKEMEWSPDSRYLAAVEWMTTDYQEGPITRVALFDMDSNRVSSFKAVNKGFAGNFAFGNGCLAYKKIFKGQGKVEEAEVEIAKISNWEDVRKLS